MTGQRSIFEEVGTAAKAAPVQTGAINGVRRGRTPVRRWLMVLFALVVAMIAVGGMTRLTDSGLSITEWRPVTGAVPPMTETDWTSEFTKYQATPEFQLQNKAMTLPEFKSIYWWEWGHRQLGRTIGLVWAIGFLFFWATRRIPPGWVPRLLVIGALGGLQGVIGWWMVSSGLGGAMVDVASYRLAVHLGLAFIILGFLAWFILSLSRPESVQLQARRQAEPRLFGMATGLMHLAFVQILLGALVAGIDADAFHVLGDGATWRAFFENPGLVQFMHRMAGYLLLVYGAVLWLRSRRSSYADTRAAFALAGIMLLLQAGLGIVTALYAAPLHLGLTHQFGAVVLWVLILRARHRARYPIVGSVRGKP
jgi:heme a synthase